VRLDLRDGGIDAVRRALHLHAAAELAVLDQAAVEDGIVRTNPLGDLATVAGGGDRLAIMTSNA
jgi:hypothetical protein